MESYFPNLIRARSLSLGAAGGGGHEGRGSLDEPGAAELGAITQARSVQPLSSMWRHGFAVLVATLAGWLSLSCATLADTNAERSLSFRHSHTNETLSIVYWRDGLYRPSALEAINHFLRDFRTGEETAIDPELLDLLFNIYERTGSQGHFEIISAYRSPKTNEMLRGRSKGVAKKSQHLLGKAVDVRLTDVPIETIREVAYELGVGGIGLYRRSQFVHLDTGRFRTW